MLQLKNVREVVREDGNEEPTGVVVTQVINNDCALLIMSKCVLNSHVKILMKTWASVRPPSPSSLVGAKSQLLSHFF